MKCSWAFKWPYRILTFLLCYDVSGGCALFYKLRIWTYLSKLTHWRECFWLSCNIHLKTLKKTLFTTARKCQSNFRMCYTGFTLKEQLSTSLRPPMLNETWLMSNGTNRKEKTKTFINCINVPPALSPTARVKIGHLDRGIWFKCPEQHHIVNIGRLMVCHI